MRGRGEGKQNLGGFFKFTNPHYHFCVKDDWHGWPICFGSHLTSYKQLIIDQVDWRIGVKGLPRDLMAFTKICNGFASFFSCWTVCIACSSQCVARLICVVSMYLFNGGLAVYASCAVSVLRSCLCAPRFPNHLPTHSNAHQSHSPTFCNVFLSLQWHNGIALGHNMYL